ncbi:MAG: DUF1345 domain-containing protein [Telluria sp.]
MTRQKQLLRHFIRSRPHLSLAIGLGIVVGLVLPPSDLPLTRALFGWNAAVWTYLISMMWLIAHSDHSKVRAIADKQDENAGLVLVTLTVGAVLSFSAIVWELGDIPHLKPDQRALRYVFTAVTVLGSWLLVGVLFCFHYAHQFYRTKPRPLQFPNNLAEPDYWDFLYFSFTIAVAVQTSDVTVLTRPMRKLVLGHSVLAFFFNLAILGLSINIAAGMLNQ